MQPADNEFFEEYKHLDSLCGDMYSCRNGISEYIDQMDSKSHQGVLSHSFMEFRLQNAEACSLGQKSDCP